MAMVQSTATAAAAAAANALNAQTHMSAAMIGNTDTVPNMVAERYTTPRPTDAQQTRSMAHATLRVVKELTRPMTTIEEIAKSPAWAINSHASGLLLNLIFHL